MSMTRVTWTSWREFRLKIKLELAETVTEASVRHNLEFSILNLKSALNTPCKLFYFSAVRMPLSSLSLL